MLRSVLFVLLGCLIFGGCWFLTNLLSLACAKMDGDKDATLKNVIKDNFRPVEEGERIPSQNSTEFFFFISCSPLFFVLSLIITTCMFFRYLFRKHKGVGDEK